MCVDVTTSCPVNVIQRLWAQHSAIANAGSPARQESDRPAKKMKPAPPADDDDSDDDVPVSKCSPPPLLHPPPPL